MADKWRQKWYILTDRAGTVSTYCQKYEDTDSTYWHTYEDTDSTYWQTYEDTDSTYLQTYEDTDSTYWHAYEDRDTTYWQTLINFEFSDCENVWSCDCNIWRVLVALPYLLHVLLLQPVHHEGLVHPPHVPGFLLAGHVQLLCQSYSVLCHE